MARAQILVVEDESIVAADLQNRLASVGYAVPAVAVSGEEAIQKVAEWQPDLVLMDIVLKGPMDGIAAADQIRTRFNIPVVYLTAYADEITLQRAKVTEPFGYILKPFEEQELQTTIEIALYKHQMERKLKESEQWLTTTLKSIGDAVIATDTQSMITFINPVAEALTGWTKAEALGRQLGEVFQVIDEPMRTPRENPATKALREGKVVELANHVLVAKDGTERPIDDSAAPIRDEAGTIIGVVLVFRDITEERQLQAQLARSERLKALGVMAGGIAHNFNNVLTGVLGHAQLLQMRTDDPRITHSLKLIEKAAQDGAQIVRRLLEFTETQWDTLLNLVDCNQVVRDAIELIRPHWEQARQAAGHPIEVKMPLGANVTVLGSAVELRQVLVGLIFNATEAMPEGGHLTITTRRQGDQVIMDVQDMGVGMDEFTQQHAFDPFFSTKATVGAGLGLTRCFHIIERHRGTIELKSTPGKGTSVIITLPYATDRLETALAAPRLVEITSRRLLIVDDDEVIREVLGMMLTNAGHTAVACESGPAALAKLEQESFDLAFVNLSMPVMGGWELIEILNRRWPQMPIVVMTGWIEAIQPPLPPVAIDGFLEKPFGYEQLSRALSTALQGRRRNS